MADSGMAEKLKLFAQNITSSSVNERKKILGDVVPCVENAGFPENALKGIFRHLLLTLERYHDPASRRAVANLVAVCAQRYPAGCVKYLVTSMNDLAQSLCKIHPSAYHSGIALTALNWCCIVVRVGLKSAEELKGDGFSKLVALQAQLAHVAQATTRKSISGGAYMKLRRTWKEVKGSAEKYASAVLALEGSVYNFGLIGCVIKFFHETRDQDNLAKYKVEFLNSYVKNVLGCRTRPPRATLLACQPLLIHVDHEAFKETVLPAVDRAMLRNPEIQLEAYSALLDSVTLDLSPYVDSLGKHLATHCHSMNEELREIAVNACRHLAKQCSDPDAVNRLVKYFFKVLNGSEGKLSVIDQRMAMLAAIGNLSYNTVSGTQSVQSLSADVEAMFIPTLQTEVHEGTLIHAVAMYTLWTAKFSTDVPIKCQQWIQTGMGQKSSTALVRNAYIHCINATFTGDTLQQASNLLPILKSSVEKAAGQNSAVALVSEAVNASCFLVKLASVDINTDGQLAEFWEIITDAQKQLFTNEKFLSSASQDALQCVATLAERMVLNHHQKLSPAMSQEYYRAVVHVLARGGYEQRKHAAACVKKMLAVLGGVHISIALLKEYDNFLQSQSLEEFEKEQLSENPDLACKMVTPRILTETLVTLSNVPKPDPAEAALIVMETLYIAHHSCIAHHNPDVWTEVMFRLNVDAADFVEKNIDTILADLKNSTKITSCQQTAVGTLCRISPRVVLPRLTSHVYNVLRDPAFLTVSRRDYDIMCHPEGELYDKSVIESGGKEDEQVANMKRESKLYSYADQKAEFELKKEIERKKKLKDGGKPEVKLTKKQHEAMAAQLVKESEIRAKAKQLDVVLEAALSLVEAAIVGNPPSLRQHLPSMVQALSALMPSPLASPRASETYTLLRTAAFDEEHAKLGELVSQCSLRLLRPACYLDHAWSGEPLAQQTRRAIKLLHSLTVSGSPHEPLPAPTLAYSFPLLQKALDKGAEVVGGAEDIIVQVLDIMSTHAKLRATVEEVDGEFDEKGPELLPREAMLRVCARVVATHAGPIQRAAIQALLDTAQAGSGKNGCAIAEQGEVDALMDGLQAPAASVREASLEALLLMEEVLPTEIEDEDGLQLTRRVWVAKHDTEPDNVKLADRLWALCELTLSAALLCPLLVQDVVHEEEALRQAAADALAAAVHAHPEHVQACMVALRDLYEEKLYRPPPVLDSFGRIISEAPPDQWAARAGVAMAMGKLSRDLQNAGQIEELFMFMVEKGLGDRHELVRKHMLQAAVTAINEHGKTNVNTLLPVFEDFLMNSPDSASLDSVKQSVVILMGSLAKHLDKTDPKVKPIVAKLIETLSTPSQPVQEAVANCLHPLVPAIKQDAPGIVRSLLDLLLNSENYGERKGAAYGLAGLVKGLGILSLKQLDVMPTLSNALQDKKNPKSREGALFAFEMLCQMLGRMFEPYVVHILPHLLLCFGDNNQHVREAADDCAKAVMSNLSGHGVKLVLPSLLSAIEEDSWRTKTGSVELLGAMAFCAPKQLSACLPSIVPKLTEVLTDSHPKVQKAGAQALKQIGSVIRNPEIQAIVPTLLEAIQDPTKKTTKCLTKLLETKFIHFIDAPSLALIMPVVQRSFQDRSTETRKMAAQIIGNMYSLTDQKDLSPYLSTVIPGLKQSLLDPVPDVRSVSARALGAMVKGMGEKGFEEMLPWLMETLTSENNPVDRSGAAQGLAEVVGGLGVVKLRELMPDIISTAERNDIAPNVRDGYIMLYIFLPNVFGDEFTEYVGPAIPSILKALADENEFVRETALRAGQRIVNMYADTAIELLLPELEKGLFHDNWRIRYSSVQLLGDLLYLISGVTGKMTTESASEDDNFGTESSSAAILRTLGMERRNRVLAGLYMGRSDTALMVRQAALHVWKVIVTHTPKTLREILATLFHLLLSCLASTSYDKRQVAARTLGDIVRKLGEKVLPEIIPILEKGLESEQADERQGVCIGLSEIMSSTSKEHVVVFADSLVPTVRRALLDPLPEVRQAAATTFDQLHATVGSRALDDILPYLLKELSEAPPPRSEHALDGLKQVMAVKSRVVLPYLVPVLTKKPVNTRALSFFSSVAGDALTKHLGKILPALMSALSEKIGTESEAKELQYCQDVVLSIQEDGLRSVIDELLAAKDSSKAGMRWASVTLLHAYCAQTKVDYLEYVPVLFRGVLHVFADDDARVLSAAWDCLGAIIKKLDANEMLNQIGTLRQAVRYAVSDLAADALLPGLCIPKKGITSILPIYREGLLNGLAEQKEQAAVGLGEVIRRTSADALKPSVVHITGPLIRILGDRFNFTVKVAVLETLALLLSKCGAMLKPFLPQLQTTFIKALNDPNRAVRLKAAGALGKLIIIHTRVDPVFTELHTGIKAAEDTSIRDTMLQAMRGCIVGAGSRLGAPLRAQLISTLEAFMGSAATDDSTRTTAAAAMGTLCAEAMSEDEMRLLLNMQLLEVDTSSAWQIRHGRAVALGVALSTDTGADRLLAEEKMTERISKAVCAYSQADRVPISMAGLRALGHLLRHYIKKSDGKEMPPTQLLTVLAKCLKQESNEIKQLAALIITYLARSVDCALCDGVLRALVPMLVNGTKEKNTLVRTNCEQALVALLRLRQKDNTYQSCLSVLESGMKDSLTEVHNKTLKKLVAQPDLYEDSIDDTILV